MELNNSINDYMTTNIIVLSREEPLQTVVDNMADHNLSTILLIDDSKISGIISERDVVHRIKDNDISSLKAKDIMTPSPLISIGSGQSINDVLKLMKSNHIKSVPIIEAQGTCIGMITQTDIVRSLDK